MNSDSDIDYDDQDEELYSEDETSNTTYEMPKKYDKNIIHNMKKKMSSPQHSPPLTPQASKSHCTTKNEVTTEGIDEEKIKTINLALIQDLVQCHCCAKYYDKTMIASDEIMGIGEQMCKHCLCWLNYNPETRFDFDMKCVGLSGFCIAEYILSCSEAHNTTKCTRMTDKGGCLLCDYILDLDIPNILNREILPKFSQNIAKVNTTETKKIVQKRMIVDNDINLKNIGDFKMEKLII